jgi:hypothetical protein
MNGVGQRPEEPYKGSMKTSSPENEPACVCGAPPGQEAHWALRVTYSWEWEPVCCCPPDEAGARAAGCQACRWSHVIGPDGLGCPWVRAVESGDPRQQH